MRAVIAAARGRTEEAAKLFGGPLTDLKPYPKPFAPACGSSRPKALLDYGDPIAAQNFIEPLKSDAPTSMLRRTPIISTACVFRSSARKKPHGKPGRRSRTVRSMK